MVDYYALISPTIEPLANAPPEERRIVYDRLVKMLDQQLRAADPPRSDKDILKERINLEAAIRRVERRIVGTNKPTVEPVAVANPPPLDRPLRPETIATSVADLEPISEQEPEILSQIESLPAAQWPASDDQFHAPINTLPTAARIGATMPSSSPWIAAEPEQPPPTPEEPPERLIVKAPLAFRAPEAESIDEVEANVEPQNFETEFDDQDLLVAEEEAPVPIYRGADIRPGAPSGTARNGRGLGLSSQAKGVWLRIGIVALVILALAATIGGIAEYLSQRSVERLASRTQAPAADATLPGKKLTDRLPVAPDEVAKSSPAAPGTPAGTTPNGDTSDQELLIQHAILLEEPPGGVGDPKRTMGRVSWKLETIRSSLATSSDIGARATIDLGEAGLTASVVFRRNRDQTSANTHLIEITMNPSADNPNGKVRDISVPELRTDEKSRGATLAGIAVPVSDNVFLIGLNGLPADLQRNIDLLRSRSWFLIPMRYANGKRALLLFEKGKPGERVFEDAMQTWQ